MSSYKLAQYPRDKFRFRLFDNIFQYKTAAEVLAAHPGAVGCINLGCFALTDIPSAGVQYLDHQCAVMICGGWVRSPEWPWPGLCIDAEGYATVGYESDAKYDYIASVQADYIGGKQTNTKAWGRNGVTYTGWLADGTMVALLASADDGLTSAEAVQILLAEGCVSILRWDGSWSSQG